MSHYSVLERIVDLKKIIECAFHTLSQYVRHGTFISTRTLTRELKNTSVEASYRTIKSHLSSVNYVKKFPETTSLLTEACKQKHVGR